MPFLLLYTTSWSLAWAENDNTVLKKIAYILQCSRILKSIKWTICTYVCVCAHICTCMCVCVCVCMCVCACTVCLHNVHVVCWASQQVTKSKCHSVHKTLVSFSMMTRTKQNVNCITKHLGNKLKLPIFQYYNGILVPVRTSFGLCWHGSKMYNVST